MFCCQLEELIRWLYTVVDVTGSWVPPSPDAESVLASLRRYLEFRKDVADHQSLTESVLERGEALLDCMASNSPALKETLALIAKQSEELESHAEHLYKSILAALGGKDGGQDKEGAAHGCSLDCKFIVVRQKGGRQVLAATSTRLLDWSALNFNIGLLCTTSCRSRTHSFFNLGSHGHERLFYICGILCTGFQKRNSKRICKFLQIEKQ
ncbi:hypothetical protein DV515_00003927 [Chloebia gouldiae]|uniref:Uncharacterized protein n=1 Tax=Chloebia gouldiae TaxID=44316 RepID=A0A3L8SRH9_CHLGU|nr:hypothetical protein DV515_00003927 [Chloebia gouldiae]